MYSTDNNKLPINVKEPPKLFLVKNRLMREVISKIRMKNIDSANILVLLNGKRKMKIITDSNADAISSALICKISVNAIKTSNIPIK